MRMEIERRSVVDLLPYAGNARTHTPEQVSQIAASIRAFGWTNPILIDDDGGIIAGHGRLMAAKLIGMDTVPCLSMTGLSDEQKRAYILADNKLALNAGWDLKMLAAELQELDSGAIDMTLTGFTDKEMEKIALGLPVTHEDRAADPDSDDGDDEHTQRGIDYGVVVMCNDLTEQNRVYQQFAASGYRCKAIA